MNTLDKVSHAAERKAMEVAIDHIVKGLDKDRTGEYLKLIDLAEKFYGKGFTKENYDAARKAVQDPNNKWVNYINSVIDDANPEFIKKTALNLGYEAFFRGTKTIRENRKKYNCNIPWLILFDPTSACNMHCKGCWSGTYGHKSNLSFEDMDKIVTQGKELGVYLYLLTGGEPLVKKREIIKLAEKHNDVEFAIFSNSTLIDDAFCKELVRLGNITFLLSIEGTPETNDARRGAGHFEAVMKAMDLLKKYGIVFGTSICYTVLMNVILTSIQWISRMMVNMLVDVLQVVETTSISTLMVMLNHVYLFIIQIQIFMKTQFLKCCSHLYSWLIMKDSHLMKTI